MKGFTILVLSLFACSALALGCKKGIAVDCATKMRDVKVEKKDVGSSFMVKCPAACSAGSVYGVDTYTTDSSVCLAAVHAGVIKADKGGAVKVTVVKGLDKYEGSDKNGVKSSEWKTSWGDTAFTVSDK